VRMHDRQILFPHVAGFPDFAQFARGLDLFRDQHHSAGFAVEPVDHLRMDRLTDMEANLTDQTRILVALGWMTNQPRRFVDDQQIRVLVNDTKQFIRHAATERDFRLTMPSEYLATHPTQQIVEPAASTWGENGHLAVWLDPSNAWIYPQLNAAALRMCEVAERYAACGPNVTDTCDRVLKQLARELLLAQSSDWAFLMKTGTAREYATQRTIDHLARFNRLHDQFVANDLDEEFLRDCEWRDNLFPNVNWRYYA